MSRDRLKRPGASPDGTATGETRRNGTFGETYGLDLVTAPAKMVPKTRLDRLPQGSQGNSAR